MTNTPTTTTTPAAYDSRPDTLLHCLRVGELIIQLATNALARATKHDLSKIEPPEVDAFDRSTPRLAGLKFGSAAYRESLADLGPALDHHYAVNRHHPEHAETGIEWRPVPGYEGHFEVSSWGDVRSAGRRLVHGGPTDNMWEGPRAIQAQVTPKGYLRVQLSLNGERRSFLIHRLVAAVFLTNSDQVNLPEVRHRDGNRRNNRADNLEWTTTSGNRQHPYDTGMRDNVAKYVVHCPELDLTTIGASAMESALHERGYPQASAAGVWRAMDSNGSHLGLTFEGTDLAEHRRSRVNHMTLVDLVEMLADWRAATERHRDGDLRRSILVNQDRFGMSDELTAILNNTATELGWATGEGSEA